MIRAACLEVIALAAAIAGGAATAAPAAADADSDSAYLAIRLVGFSISNGHQMRWLPSRRDTTRKEATS